MMRTNPMNFIRKRAGRGVESFLLLACFAFMMTGCVPSPKSTMPIAEISVTNGHLIVQNHTGHVWFNAKITIDDKYTYVAEVMPAVRSSVPLAEFVDDRGQHYERGRLSIRNVSIDVTDTLGDKQHYHW